MKKGFRVLTREEAAEVFAKGGDSSGGGSSDSSSSGSASGSSSTSGGKSGGGDSTPPSGGSGVIVPSPKPGPSIPIEITAVNPPHPYEGKGVAIPISDGVAVEIGIITKNDPLAGGLPEPDGFFIGGRIQVK